MTDDLLATVRAWLDDDEQLRIPDTKWGRSLYDAITGLADEVERLRQPCDGLCTTFEADPMCSRHGKTPAEIWGVARRNAEHGRALRARLDVADHLHAAAAFLAAWRRGEGETHALDEADDLDAAVERYKEAGR